MEHKAVPIESITADENDHPCFLAIHSCTDDVSEDFPTVTKCVRQMYYEYLKNTLRERNKEVVYCKATEGIKTDEMICYLAKQMELKALNACMVADIYRKEMLEQINSVKYETVSMPHSDESVNINVLSVQEINEIYLNVNDSLDNVNIKPEIIDIKPEISIIPMDETADLDIKMELEPMNSKDEIFNKMAELFKYEEKTSLEDIIFGITEVQIMPLDDKASSPTETIILTVNDQKEDITTESVDLNLRYTSVNAKRSFWPAEECVQSAILREQMTAINEINPVKYKTVMNKFESIFGDQEVSSALPATTEALRNACKERIGHYVVNCLTSYYRKGQIKTRLLFKLLSRAIVQKIYRHDPYIDGEIIWKSIRKVFYEELFVLIQHTQLMSAVSKIFDCITKLPPV